MEPTVVVHVFVIPIRFVVTVVVSVASVDVVVVVVVMVESDGLANGLAGGERDLGGLAEALRLGSKGLRLGILGTGGSKAWRPPFLVPSGRRPKAWRLPGRLPLLLTPNMDAVVAVFATDMLCLLLLLICSCSWHRDSCLCRQKNN